MQVEFVDRYTGDPRGRPTYFNGCRAGCEAMGVRISCEPVPGVEPDEDGYSWYPCPACKGTGRVGKLVGLTRIPSWLVKGARFLWGTNLGGNRSCRVPWHTRWQHLALTFKCAYLVDLGLWQP